jgi:hypothetical protein
MVTPRSRKEFEQNLNILAEKIEQRRFSMPPMKRLGNSLLSVTKSPNGRFNLLSVDESVRLMANSLANFDRPEFKRRFDAEK